MPKVFKYYCTILPRDWVKTTLSPNRYDVELESKNDLIVLSPVDAISLGRKLIKFGQQQIDRREIENSKNSLHD